MRENKKEGRLVKARGRERNHVNSPKKLFGGNTRRQQRGADCAFGAATAYDEKGKRKSVSPAKKRRGSGLKRYIRELRAKAIVASDRN